MDKQYFSKLGNNHLVPIVGNLVMDDGESFPVSAYTMSAPNRYRLRNNKGFGEVDDSQWPDPVFMYIAGLDIALVEEKNNSRWWSEGYRKAPKPTFWRYFAMQIHAGRQMGYPYPAVLAFAWRHRTLYKRRKEQYNRVDTQS